LDSAEDSCICSDAASFAKQRLTAFEVSLSASRSQIIDENSGWADENTVFCYYSIPKKDAALKSATIAQPYFAFDKCVIADVTILANDCSSEYMCKCPDTRSRANLHALVDQSV